MKIPRGGLPAHEVGPFFFVIQLRMMCNYNGLASQEYLRGVTSFTEVRSEGVRFAREPDSNPRSPLEDVFRECRGSRQRQTGRYAALHW